MNWFFLDFWSINSILGPDGYPANVMGARWRGINCIWPHKKGVFWLRFKKPNTKRHYRDIHSHRHTHTQKKTNMMCTKDKELKHENLCVASQPLKIMENSCLCHPQIFTLIPEINSNPVPELDDGSSFRAQKQPPEVFKPMKMPWDFVTTLHTDVPWKLKVVGLMNIFAILSWSVESSVLSVLSSCDVFVILHDGCMVSDGIW